MKVVTLLLFFICVTLVSAQRKSISKNAAQKTVRSSSYLSLPFETSQKNLPPSFLGHNANLLLPSVLSMSLEVLRQCGKFEKRNACQVRLNRLYFQQITPGIKTNDLLAFSIPTDCDYDPEQEKVSCYSMGMGGFTWSNKLIRSRNYVGSNAFGAKVLVEYKLFENIIIDPVETRYFDLKNIPPAKAQILVPKLRLLVIGALRSPFGKSEDVNYPPTITDPSHTEGKNYTILLTLREIWLYDFVTGTVYAKK